MAIIELKNGYFKVTHSKRHPKTKKPNGLSRTHYVDTHGRKQPITTKAQAKKVEKILVIELEKKLKKVKIPNFQNLLRQFEPYYLSSGVTKKTVDTYMFCLRKHTSEWTDLPCDEVTGVMIRTLIDRIGDTKSESHKKNILKFIRKIFEFALESGFVNTNPTPNMKFRIGAKNAQVLKESEITQLLTTAKNASFEWYPHWFMALYTGLRNGELYALRWEHIDFNSKLIQVKEAWNNVDGFKSTKSGDERIVPIADDLISLLKELKLSGHHPEFVLPRHYLWDKGEQARVLRAFLIGNNLPPVRFHDLRASWATALLTKGAEPVKVMSMGGWKNMKTMMIYIRKAGIDIQGTTNCLNFLNPENSTGKLLDMPKLSM